MRYIRLDAQHERVRFITVEESYCNELVPSELRRAQPVDTINDTHCAAVNDYWWQLVFYGSQRLHMLKVLARASGRIRSRQRADGHLHYGLLLNLIKRKFPPGIPVRAIGILYMGNQIATSRRVTWRLL
jgi:hypothetical protein